MQRNEELVRSINQAILRDERLSSQPIEISIDNGIVTLIGSVQSYRRKLAAYELVSSFEGCRDVVNNLTIEPLGHLPDEEIAGNVRAALDSQADITKETIAVSVAAGVVSLNGNIGSL